MKIHTTLILFATLPMVLSRRDPDIDNEKRRRELSAVMELPGSCYEMSDTPCKDFSTDAMPDTSTFDAEVAFALVDWGCCAMRKDDPKELHDVAIKFREVCESTPYLEWQRSLTSHKGLTSAERSIVQYCPNYISPEEFYNPTWADLWNVVILGHQSSAFLRCNGPRKGNGRVTVTINGLEEDMWPHVWITAEDGRTFSWSSAHPSTDLSSFDTVTGVEGRFAEEAAKFEIPLDAPTWTVEGVNMENLLDEKERIASAPYNLIQNNCAHVALKLLSAGLGCDATIVPFFSPASMIKVMDKVAPKCNV